jgi:hypothetical protein
VPVFTEYKYIFISIGKSNTEDLSFGREKFYYLSFLASWSFVRISLEDRANSSNPLKQYFYKLNSFKCNFGDYNKSQDFKKRFYLELLEGNVDVFIEMLQRPIIDNLFFANSTVSRLSNRRFYF